MRSNFIGFSSVLAIVVLLMMKTDLMLVQNIQKPPSSTSNALVSTTITNATIPTTQSPPPLTHLVIAATVRNVAIHLPILKQRVLAITSESFELVACYFYENDSNDDTISILQHDWTDICPILNLTSTTTTTTTTATTTTANSARPRTKLLAEGRNHVWELLKQDSSKFQFDYYVLWMDMDEVNYGLAHLETCWDLPADWSVCCANQYHLYYDLWALRTIEHKEGDQNDKDDNNSRNNIGTGDIANHKSSSTQPSPDAWFMPCDWKNTCSDEFRERERRRSKHIPAAHPPIRVRSCFGGAALYKYNHLKHLNLSTYQGTLWVEPDPPRPTSKLVRRTSKETCEHVAFHESLQQQNPNLSIYIQPKFLNAGQPFSTFLPRVVDTAKPFWEASFRDPSCAKWYDARPTGPEWTWK